MASALMRCAVAGVVTGGALLTTAALPAAADVDCPAFETQAQAQRFFLAHDPLNDPNRLDADHDGVACESLPAPHAGAPSWLVMALRRGSGAAEGPMSRMPSGGVQAGGGGAAVASGSDLSLPVALAAGGVALVGSGALLRRRRIHG